MMQPPRELIEFLHPYGPAIQSLALGLRTVVLEEMTSGHEYIFVMRSKVVLLYSATERVIADCIFSINVFTRHVTLVFHRGTDLNDPRGVLRGSGKAMRHLRIAKLSELDRPEIRALLRQARRHAGAARINRGTANGVVTRVKSRTSKRAPSLTALWNTRET